MTVVRISERSFRLRNPSFARRSAAEYEREYEHLREQMFDLKYHLNFSLVEQAYLTAQDRKWWLERLKKQKEAENKQTGGGHTPGMGPRPSMPSIPKH